MGERTRDVILSHEQRGAEGLNAMVATLDHQRKGSEPLGWLLE
jgi:hypothetical protein